VSVPSHPDGFHYPRLLVKSYFLRCSFPPPPPRPMGRPEQYREPQRVPREYTHIYTMMPPSKHPKLSYTFLLPRYTVSSCRHSSTRRLVSGLEQSYKQISNLNCYVPNISFSNCHWSLHALSVRIKPHTHVCQTAC